MQLDLHQADFLSASPLNPALLRSEQLHQLQVGAQDHRAFILNHPTAQIFQYLRRVIEKPDFTFSPDALSAAQCTISVRQDEQASRLSAAC